jgi:hypothetical protein
MVCSRCSALPITNPKRRWKVQHYSTFAELDKSVRNGCQVCALLRTVLLEYYAHGLSSSVEEAECYHRQLDQHPESRDNEHSDSEESVRRSQDSRRFPFFVKDVSYETASDSEQQFEGLRGLLYLRVGAEAFDPVDHIYPFIQVSSLPGKYIPQPKY